jgi:hypothetical protein
MTWSITSPITGATMSQFTTPTYTVVTDVYPGGVNGKQNAVTALGGTQTGVRAHAVSDPFTITCTRPVSPKALQSPNAVTGKYTSVPKNTYGVLVRKGVNFAANNAPAVAILRMSLDIPAGSDAYDSANIRAMISAGIGALYQQSQGLADTLVNGVI